MQSEVHYLRPSHAHDSLRLGRATLAPFLQPVVQVRDSHIWRERSALADCASRSAQVETELDEHVEKPCTLVAQDAIWKEADGFR